jgi:SH3-like domain-containing protein
MMAGKGIGAILAASVVLWLAQSGAPVLAQDQTAEPAVVDTSATIAPPAEGTQETAVATAKPAKPPRDPNRGAVTNLPLPRYVSLKSDEGNARRGPGRTHRIDWVFNRAGMPLKITAEHEHWRRIEDMDGAGGWVHYSLLSGVRTALVTQDLAELRSKPDDRATVVLQAELGVIARLLECRGEWCRLGTAEGKGWVRKTALWGVEPDEVLE